MTEQRRKAKIRQGLDIIRDVRDEMKEDGESGTREHENVCELVAQIEEFCTYHKI